MFALLLTTSDHVITYRKKKVNPIFDIASKIQLWFHYKNFCRKNGQIVPIANQILMF